MTELDLQTIEKQLKDGFGDTDTSGQVEAIKTIFDEKNIKMKSHVDKKLREAEYFGKLYTLSKLLKIKALESYADEVITLRISNDRRGRLEAVQMIKQIEDQPKKGGFFNWFR